MILVLLIIHKLENGGSPVGFIHPPDGGAIYAEI
jgi:hypothetical protein